MREEASGPQPDLDEAMLREEIAALEGSASMAMRRGSTSGGGEAWRSFRCSSGLARGRWWR
jgi:hypothetical protein